MQGLEPAAILAGGLQTAGPELLDDIGGGAALPLGAGRATFERVAGELPDVAEQVGRSDRAAERRAGRSS